MVALSLDRSKKIERKIQIVIDRPYDRTILAVIIVITSRRCKIERNLILIIIILDIRTKADEDREVAILEIGGIIDHSLGMHPHL